MIETDNLLPEVLPTIGDIQYVFDNSYSREMIGVVDMPEYRLEIINKTFLKSMTHTAFMLHRSLTYQSAGNNRWLSGRKTARGNGPEEKDEQYITHGLDRQEDFETYILPQLRASFGELQDGSLGVEETLERMSALVGVTIAESQVFSDGNNRIARTLHDFIRDGRENIDPSRIFDKERAFSAPKDIEGIILEQNTARLVNKSFKPMEYEITGGVYVHQELKDSVASNAEYLHDIFEQIKEKHADVLPSIFSRNLRKSVEREYDGTIADDSYHKEEALMALRSINYAPAAWTVAFGNKPPTWPLSASNLEKFFEADRALHIMRIMSLMGSIVAGGRIVQITANDQGDKVIETRQWWPSASMK